MLKAGECFPSDSCYLLPFSAEPSPPFESLRCFLMKSSIDSSSSNSSFSGLLLLACPASLTTIDVLISVGLICFSESGLSSAFLDPSADWGVDSDAYEECLPELTSRSTMSRSSTIASSKLSLFELIFLSWPSYEFYCCSRGRFSIDTLF